jgi:hypothetical protein
VTDPFELLRTALGIDLHERDLAGGVVSAEIPLTNELVDRLIATQLQRPGGLVTAARVEALGDDRFTAEVTVRAPIPLPPLRIQGRIEDQPRFPAPAVLGIRWTMPALGPLAMFAGPALSFLKKLPPGMSVDGDRVAVDVDAVLRGRGFGHLLRFVTRAEVHTRQGGFVLRVELRL